MKTGAQGEKKGRCSSCKYSWGDRDRKIPEICWPASLAKLVRFSLTNKQVGERWKKITLFWPLASTHTCTRTLIKSPIKKVRKLGSQTSCAGKVWSLEHIGKTAQGNLLPPGASDGPDRISKDSSSQTARVAF